MKSTTYFTTLLLSLVFITCAVQAQDNDEKVKAQQKKIIKEEKIRKERAEQKQQQIQELKRQYEAQRHELSESQLQEIEEKLRDLQNNKLHEIRERLHEVDLRHLRHIAEIELQDIEIDIPEINIPDIEIPDIDIEIPDMDFDFDFDFDHDFDENEHIIYIDGDRRRYVISPGPPTLFSDLAEDEQLKIQAIRALDKNNKMTTLPTLHKLINEEPSPAIRYTAVKKLRYFLDDEKSIELLGEIAKSDPNRQVRKAAIGVLGKSNNGKAKQILLDLAKDE